MPIWWAHPARAARPALEAARFAADNGIFLCYPHAMGGALATVPTPIKLAHLIEEQASSHGERLMGITSARLGIKTRLQGWEVSLPAPMKPGKPPRLQRGGWG